MSGRGVGRVRALTVDDSSASGYRVNGQHVRKVRDMAVHMYDDDCVAFANRCVRYFEHGEGVNPVEELGLLPLETKSYAGVRIESTDFPSEDGPHVATDQSMFLLPAGLQEELSSGDLDRVLAAHTLNAEFDGRMNGLGRQTKMYLGTPPPCKIRLQRNLNFVHSNCVITEGLWFTAGHWEYGLSETTAYIAAGRKLWVIAKTQNAGRYLVRKVTCARNLLAELRHPTPHAKNWRYVWAKPGTLIVQPNAAAHCVWTMPCGLSWVGGWEAQNTVDRSHARRVLNTLLERFGNGSWKQFVTALGTDRFLQANRDLDAASSETWVEEDGSEETSTGESECTHHLRVLVDEGGFKLEDLLPGQPQ